MNEELRKNIEIVLVEPKVSGNVGMAARAMHNMGFENLSLVNPGDYQSLQEKKLGYNSGHIIDNAKVFPDLVSAIKDCGFAVAMTRRHGKDRGRIEVLNEASKEIYSLAKNTRVAIVFGRESHGLENEELLHCHRYVKIHTATNYPSLNLGQAVMATCYELLNTTPVIIEDKPRPADIGDLERCYEHIEKTLHLIGYGIRGQKMLPHNILGVIRKMVGRALPDKRDVSMVRGLCSQVEKMWDPESRKELDEMRRKGLFEKQSEFGEGLEDG